MRLHVKQIAIYVLLLCSMLSYCTESQAQTNVALSPVSKQQFFSVSGAPLASGCLNTYVTGTSTPLATFVDSTGATQNANPIILDGGGFANIWLSNAAYRFVLVAYDGIPGNKCAAGVTQYTIDGINAFAPISTGANLFLLGQASDPAGTAGEMVYRNDIPCFRFFTTFWDCVVRLTDTQTLTNKTLTTPTITSPTISGTITGTPTATSWTMVTPVINGASTGTGVFGTGTKLATTSGLSALVPVCTDASGNLTSTCPVLVTEGGNFAAKAQTAAIGTTTVFTCTTLGAPSTCHIQANFYIVTQTSGTGTTASVTVAWNDGETSIAESVQSSNINLNVLGSVQQGTAFAQLANGGTLTFSTTVGSIGTSKYSVYVYVIAL